MIARDEKRKSRVTRALQAGKTPALRCRVRNRCGLCGRPRGYIRYFDMCRICIRQLASSGLIPGLRKSSW
ncbi:MAG: type Z 30S ribosomal protein S14 [Candidatus Peregrinibacteria bacterium]